MAAGVAPPAPRSALALKIGAEALLGRAHGLPLGHERAAGIRTGQGPELEGPFNRTTAAEEGAQSSRLRHSSIYGGGGTPASARARQVVQTASELMGGAAAAASSSRPPKQQAECGVGSQGDRTPGDDTLRYYRMFIARARRAGPHGIVRLRKAFEAASKGGGLLDEDTFIQACLAQLLGHGVYECKCIFSQLRAEQANADPGSSGRFGSSVHVDTIVEVVRGRLAPARAAAVRAVWSRLDPTGLGSVSCDALLAQFDVRRLPAVISGEVSMEVALRQFVEGLDIHGERMSDRSEFALEEAYAKRRPAPTGALGTPRDVPAGVPRMDGRLRGHADMAREVAGRPSVVRPDAQVSAADFEAYYTMLSVSMSDDDVFFASVRNPWTGREALEASQSFREAYKPKGAAKTQAYLRVFASFEDGSSRMVVLRNDEGLQHHTGSAGTSCNQHWTWGKDLVPEVIRRLQEEGIEGVKSVKLAPF